ncbi:trypsin-like serine protease [Streptomyces sp. NPDC050617]|uniref:trypsin-like serine peptidase n=1 Tax=Streptomyces sp. NPDC050617 TaxID=3154628 RepID=UPI003430C9E0
MSLLPLLLLAAAPTAYAADSPRRSTAASDDAYWTAERMAAAHPVTDGVRAGARPTAPAAEPPAPSHPFDGLPPVGTFFWTDDTGAGRSCGGTIVRSPHRDLVVGAGHCLRSPKPRRHLSFVPQYHDGQKPFGLFPVERVYIDQRYYDLGTGAGARWDYSVVRVGPRADGAEAQEAAGGFGLGVYPGYEHRRVRLIGYPGTDDATHPKPLDCRSATHRYTSTDPAAPGDFLEIACAGYIGGTSGGPFLVRSPTGYRLIGVIGGYHTGGDFPDISYSSYFTADILALYLHAVRGDAPAQPQ